ncbi:norbelladine synthase-like [Rutidosis leptorrhynchoides]|uniref:norbelladine synthase-like n=1 Tax=Rutidosis leptorrhynchoides TaxID=125765 RepID=UPI003A99BF5D
MIGSLSEETEVKAHVSKAWALYGTLELGKLVAGKLFEAVEVVEGDGGVGTILKVTLKPGTTSAGSGLEYYFEKFTKVDNQNMVKDIQIVKGGFLDIGFNYYRIKLEVIENSKDETGSSCRVKITIEYEVKDEFVANASLVNTELLVAIMGVAKEHLESFN